MGLDLVHGTNRVFTAPYSSFGTLRKRLAEKLGFNLGDMDGFGGTGQFDKLEPLNILLDHSDCDGEIEIKDLLPLAARLEEVGPTLEDGYRREQAAAIAAGCRSAHAAGEKIEFT